MVEKKKRKYNKAIIAGIFALIVAVCSCIGGIITVYEKFWLDNHPIESTQYKLHLNDAYDNITTPILFTELDRIEIGVVPTKCVVADYDGLSKQFDTTAVLKDTYEKRFGFDLVTEKPLVISNAIVRLIKYSPPSSTSNITEINLFDPSGLGGGDVQLILFPEKNINNSTDEITIMRKEGSFLLNPGDAVTLVFPIIFSDPGIYKIKFIVQGQSNLSRKVEFVSDTFVYAWLYVDDITRYPIKSFYNQAKMRWIGDCP